MPLEIEEGLTANLETMLKRGALDAIVIALPFESTGVETRALFDEPFHLLVPNEHPLAKRKAIGVEELNGEKLLLLRAGHCFRDQVLDACPGVVRDGDESRPSQGSSLETIRNMVASGLGISVFPASAVTPRYTNRLCRAIPFERPAPARHIGLAWRAGFGRIAAIDALAEAVLGLKKKVRSVGARCAAVRAVRCTVGSLRPQGDRARRFRAGGPRVSAAVRRVDRCGQSGAGRGTTERSDHAGRRCIGLRLGARHPQWCDRGKCL